MPSLRSLLVRVKDALPFNVHTIRYVYLFVGFIYIVASRTPAVEYLSPPPPSTLTPQLELFATNCQLSCVPFNCTAGCASFCSATTSSYYKQALPALADVCDSKCNAAAKSLCAGTTTCAQFCKQQAQALLQAPDVMPASTIIRVLSYLGSTFWSTLILIPLAAAHVMVAFIALGPLLRATETEIYNNRYSLFNKVIAVLESPQYFLMAATVAFEVKCLLFDDSDGYGLAITVVLQLVALACQIVPSIAQRFGFRGAAVNDTSGAKPAKSTEQGQEVAQVTASPRLSISSATRQTPPMGESI
ncbi:unnamed protein product [Aphanomyces euteiches]|uniref:Transmembrane protein n=1 Tax=Aphanomyces euteiches TaxID=100861 RepID=A0A6G0WQG3_9STRA|nr:hypothetical protein Ae201684_012882 [Aphanomyces euteiches]KAH9097570.1 hypothetical protein Ae201684P_001048 [Aphanomyces euteiches]KAH9133292.1 hypothetical protein AeRB84_020603 [Aphanomyces euteiches]